MAKIGLKYPVYKSETNQGVIGKAIQADIDITMNDGKLYGDDALAESDNSFKEGKITLGIDELSDDIQHEFLGHAINSGELTANIDDSAGYVGIGFYGTKKVSGIKKYRAVWFPKVKWSEPKDSNKTKGENIAFETPSIEGVINYDDNGDWKKEQTFATEAEAIAYLKAKAGITPICTTPVASVAAGTYAVAQSVTLTAGVGESIYYTTNGLTPSATVGTLYAAAINIASSTMLRTIAIKDGSSNSAIAEFEYNITA